MAERRTIHFAGEVQGVGFRATTLQLARRTAVGGLVRNLPDGRVELVAEGEPAEINLLLRNVREHFGSMIHDVTSAKSPATGGFDSFSIRY